MKQLGPVLAFAAVLAVIFVFQTAKHRSRWRESQRSEHEQNVVDPGEDPRLKAAEAEARRRWPEFLAAWAKREPGTAYAVKARFVQGIDAEWMWVSVESIGGTMITGTLDNEPAYLTNVKVGQRVTVRQADTDDWLVSRNGQIVQGAFTVKVLEQIDKERRRQK